MDRDRFDDLARSLAGNAPRRRVVRGIALGAMAAVSGRALEVGAQVAPSGLPQGSACAATSDCQPGAATAVICADNGLTGLACVATEGGCCSADDQCASALLCRPLGGESCLNVCVNAATAGSTFARTALIDANLRAEASVDAGILAVVPGGAAVTVFPEIYANGFVLVEYTGQRGYVFAELLA